MNDVRAIEHQNDLLHGNVLMNKDGKLSDKEINSYMMYVAYRLYTLISKLILKNAAYSGYVINNPKFSEQAAGIETDEGYLWRFDLDSLKQMKLIARRLR